MMNDTSIAPFPGATAQNATVVFGRAELDPILNIYGRMVAAGEWRDYSIGSSADEAVFAIFRRASEMPLFRIVKRPAQSRRQGAYAVIGLDGRVLKRGHDLRDVLRVFDSRLHKLAD